MFLNNTFVHHVHFWLKNKEDKAKLIEGLNMLIPITHIRDMHIGVPAGTNRDVIDRSYDVSLLLLFNTLEEEEAYQHHPTHIIFAEQYARPLCAKVVVQDNVNI